MLCRTVALLLCSAAILFPRSVNGQDRGAIGLNVAGLMSFQPADSTYVNPGGPYLKQGMGGFGPGFAVEIDRVVGSLALAGEISSAWIPVEQSGRLVPGGSYKGFLNDWMLSALVGYQLDTRPTVGRILGGVSLVSGLDVRFPLSPTAGFDIFPFYGQDARIGLFVTGRMYLRIDRGLEGQYRGAGRMAFRGGAGVRISLGAMPRR